MSKVLQTSFKSAIKYLVYFAIALQSVPAVVWIVKNIALFNGDFLAQNYIKAADTLVVDEYMGIFYALLIRLLGHGWLLYLIQLAIVAFFAWFMGGTLCLGLVVTNPVVLQSCFSCLPDALVLACVLAIVGIIKRCRKWSVLLWIAIPEVSLGLLNPDYVWIGAIVMMGIVIYKLFERQRSSFILLAVTIFSFAVSFGINSMVTDSGAYGRAEKSVEFLLVQRLNWPNIQGEVFSLHFYQKLDFGEESVDASRTAEKFSTIWAYNLEKRLGKENADAYYTYMYKSALQHGVKAVLAPIIKDELGYFFAPMNCLYIETVGEPAPSFAKAKFVFEKEEYGLFSLWFTFSLLISSVFGIVGVFKSLKWCKKNLLAFLFIALCCSLYATLICIRGFDYRNVSVIMAGWPLLILSGEKISEE